MNLNWKPPLLRMAKARGQFWLPTLKSASGLETRQTISIPLPCQTSKPARCGQHFAQVMGLSTVPAQVRVVLVTCDAAPANIKLLGHLQSVLDPKTLLLPFLCLQHRTWISGCSCLRVWLESRLLLLSVHR